MTHTVSSTELRNLKCHPRCWVIVTLTSIALDTLAESALVRPSRSTNEPVDKFFMERLSRRFPWVAPSQSLRHEREADRAVRRRMEGNGNVTVPQGTQGAVSLIEHARSGNML